MITYTPQQKTDSKAVGLLLCLCKHSNFLKIDELRGG